MELVCFVSFERFLVQNSKGVGVSRVFSALLFPKKLVDAKSLVFLVCKIGITKFLGYYSIAKSFDFKLR